MTAGTNTFKANGVDADIVVVVDDVVADREVLHITIDREVLAVSSFVVIDLVAADCQLADWRCARAVDCDSKGIATVLGLRNDVVHVIVQQLDVAAPAVDPDTGRRLRRAGCAEVANLEATDDEVTLVGDIEQTFG
jgi:hypothetical protein